MSGKSRSSRGTGLLRERTTASESRFYYYYMNVIYIVSHYVLVVKVQQVGWASEGYCCASEGAGLQRSLQECSHHTAAGKAVGSFLSVGRTSSCCGVGIAPYLLVNLTALN